MNDFTDKNHRPVIILLCGMTGSGKSTLEKRLENEFSFVRFSVDEWMISLFGHHMSRDEFDDRMANIKTKIFEIVTQLIRLKVNIVLDYGFWRREERALISGMIKNIGGYPVIYYLDVDQKILKKRLAIRNSILGKDEYEITDEMFGMFLKRFNAPNDDESVEIIRLNEVAVSNDALTKYIVEHSADHSA